MSAASIIVATIAARRAKLIAHFLRAGAVSAARAVAPAALPAMDASALAQCRTEGVIRATADGKLYLDTAQHEAVRKRRQASAIKALAAVSVFFIAVAAFAYLWSAG